jgi:hypothetical protein
VEMTHSGPLGPLIAVLYERGMRGLRLILTL